MKIFENLFELSKGALPVCLVPSKKPTTKFLTLNSCWKVYVTFQYFAHFLSKIGFAKIFLISYFSLMQIGQIEPSKRCIESASYQQLQILKDFDEL